MKFKLQSYMRYKMLSYNLQLRHNCNYWEKMIMMEYVSDAFVTSKTAKNIPAQLLSL